MKSAYFIEIEEGGLYETVGLLEISEDVATGLLLSGRWKKRTYELSPPVFVVLELVEKTEA